MVNILLYTRVVQITALLLQRRTGEIGFLLSGGSTLLLPYVFHIVRNFMESVN